MVVELGPDRLAARADEIERLLADSGLYGHGATTAAAVDPIPYVVRGEEWATIARGLRQRAELLDRVLADVYGPQALLRTGLLPAEVILSHPELLHPCHDVRLPGTRQLFTLATDLARDEGGTWRALADHTVAPAGAAHALTTRAVVARVFAEAYRDAGVQRLAPYLRALRRGLQAIAPDGSEDPRIVVLSAPGGGASAFEAGTLAAALGYPEVQGRDLVVREGRVWLRSLGHLEPVDVILRALRGADVDALELRAESMSGVPGLLEACRAGTVSVVNLPGADVLDGPRLDPFLPELARALLDEELVLPGSGAWWTGEPDGLARALDELEHLVLVPLAADAGVGAPVEGWRLRQRERVAVQRALRERPTRWLAQQPLALAPSPCLERRDASVALGARPCVVRSLTVLQGDTYAVMDGGLALPWTATWRIDRAPGPEASSCGKDVWVLSTEPETPRNYWLHQGPALVAVDPAGSMSWRAAENLFWLGRYAERAEGVVRMLRVIDERRVEFGRGQHPAGRACLDVLLDALTRVTATEPLDRAGLDAALHGLVVDAARPGTLAFAVTRLIAAAGAVRDQLSLDTWAVVGALERQLEEIARAAGEAPLPLRDALGSVLRSLLALAGLGAESMVRDPGWQLLDAGRRLERGLHLVQLLRSTVTVEHDVATESLLFESVLLAAESIITYRRRYRSHAQLETVLDLLIVDPGNPRALAFQLDRLEEIVTALPSPGPEPGRKPDPLARAVIEASTAVRLADTATLARAGKRVELDDFLAQIEQLLTRAGELVSALHFAPVPPVHLL